MTSQKQPSPPRHSAVLLGTVTNCTGARAAILPSDLRERHVAVTLFQG